MTKMPPGHTSRMRGAQALPLAIEADPFLARFFTRWNGLELAPEFSITSVNQNQFRLTIDGHEAFGAVGRRTLLEKASEALSHAYEKHGKASGHVVTLPGAAVSIGRQAAVILGPPGCGKTSIAAWLVESGFKYCCDGVMHVTAKQARGAPLPLRFPRTGAKHLAVLDNIGSAPVALMGEDILFELDLANCNTGRVAPRLIVFPEYVADGEAQFELLPPLQAAMQIADAAQALDLDDTQQIEELVKLTSSVPAIRVRYGDFTAIDGTLDKIIKFTLSEKLAIHDFSRVFGTVGRKPAPTPYPVPARTADKPSRRFTIGMATYDDYDGVYFSIQSIRLHHPEILDDCEFLIVDNHPDGPCGQPLKDLEKSIPSLRYVPVTEMTGTAVRNFIFSEASGTYVICMDCHVLFPAGTLKKLFDYFETHPDTNDLLQGPLVFDDLKKLATHFEPIWSSGMYGHWGMDDRGQNADADPFDIPMQGLGVFACRRLAWPGFNTGFRGFGGEEGYIHEKFRQAGGRTLCLPFFRWLHRFGRPLGIPYRINWEDRFHNYFVGFREIGWDTGSIETYMKELLGEYPALKMIARIKTQLDGVISQEPAEEPVPETEVRARLSEIREKSTASAIIRIASQITNLKSMLVTGPLASSLRQAALNAGIECRIVQEKKPDDAKVDAAISILDMANDSPSQAKRHVERLTTDSDLVLFQPLAGQRSYGAERDAAYWEDLFGRRGFVRKQISWKKLDKDPRLSATARNALMVFRRQSVEHIPPPRPTIQKREYANGISVILPVYNGAEFISEAIESVLVQTHQDFEFVIVDDGSTDGTREIIGNFAKLDNRIRLVHQSNGGEPVAANTALEASKYPLVARMDHDDVSLPHRLERQYAFLRENPDVAAVGAFMQPIDEHGQPHGKLMRYPVRAEDCKSALRSGFAAPIGNPAAMIRRPAALDVGSYRPLFRQAADFDFWLRLGATRKIANLPDVLLAYRIHSASSTQSRRFSQHLSAIVARLSADKRQNGLPDPLDGVVSISARTILDIGTLPTQALRYYQNLYELASRNHMQSKGLLDAIDCLRISLSLPRTGEDSP